MELHAFSPMFRWQSYCKSKTIQNKKAFFCFFIVEMQRNLSKVKQNDWKNLDFFREKEEVRQIRQESGRKLCDIHFFSVTLHKLFRTRQFESKLSLRSFAIALRDNISKMDKEIVITQEQQFAEIVGIIQKNRCAASQAVNEATLLTAWQVGGMCLIS